MGSGIGNSGVDDYWMSYAIQKAAQAIVDAYRARQSATIRYAETTQPANFLTCWSSYPYVRASRIPILQAVSTSGAVIATLFDYGIHAETLGLVAALNLRGVSERDQPHVNIGTHTVGL